MAGAHITVGLGDGVRGVRRAVLAVHVVGTGARVVAKPDTEVLDDGGRLLSDLLDADDLAGSLVDLLVVRDEVPEARLGRNWVRGEKTHTVKWWG